MNSLNTNSGYSSDIKVYLFEQVIPKLSYFDPFDAYGKSVKRKHEILVFHVDTTILNNIYDINQLFIAKPFLLKLIMKNYHPTLYSVQMMLYSKL
jgi:hypothetical protein